MNSAFRQIPLDPVPHHHAHDFHQIVIGLHGQAEFEIEGLVGSVSTLSGCIVPANHQHHYAGHGENRQLIIDLPRDAISLTGHHHELSRLFDEPAFFELDSPLRHYLNFLLEEIQQLDQVKPGASLQHERLTSTLLGSLHSRLTERQPARGRTLDLNALDRYIDCHLECALRVSDLAAKACLSEGHFSQCFSAQTGMPPWQYVMQRRLFAARRLLLETPLPLIEIAALAGFSNQSALSNAFRRAYGHPPSQLRKNISNELPRQLGQVAHDIQPD
ncbi:helix-turn-helix transcriptional regulator [Halomonas halocynthiae]|uniref:helix-turn-helix transcriptional regulator n=1 Tax=Halomonas halocynthiae TaxID=176290 RepID=UPI000412E74E|nr:AraC family transcriptional regulator [Halomonas halocynthiae]